jgi:hypothetical protein
MSDFAPSDNIDVETGVRVDPSDGEPEIVLQRHAHAGMKILKRRTKAQTPLAGNRVGDAAAGSTPSPQDCVYLEDAVEERGVVIVFKRHVVDDMSDAGRRERLIVNVEAGHVFDRSIV